MKKTKLKKLQKSDGTGERVTLQYFPAQRFVSITVPTSHLKHFTDNLVDVKRVVFQPNVLERIQNGQVEVVFDDGTQSPFVVTVDIEDFGYPTFPFLTVRDDLRVAVVEKNVPKASWIGIGESTVRMINNDGPTAVFQGTRII